MCLYMYNIRVYACERIQYKCVHIYVYSIGVELNIDWKEESRALSS